MSRVFVTHLLLSIVIAHVSAGTSLPECPPNSELRPCGSLCEPTCEDVERKLCFPEDGDSCEQECRCTNGWVRNKDTNECVEPSECPDQTATTEKPIPEPDCSCNETLSLCGRLCEPTCANKVPRVCPKIACSKFTERCRCNDGYYRDDSGECVLSEDCPVPEPKCGHNEELGNCAKACEPTCQHPVTTKCSAIYCTGQRCRCKSGYLRDEKTNKCVPSRKCSKPKCKRGEIYGACGRTCEGTCDSPVKPEICTRIFCSSRACQCDLAGGFVRDEDADECVRIEHCPIENCDD